MNTSDRTDSIMLFLFGLTYAFFHIMPAMLPMFMTGPVAWGDFLDFFTPFAVIPMAYLLYRLIRNDLLSSGGKDSLSKVLLAGGFLLYVDGHGLHLSANAIARLLQNDQGSVLFGAVYLFDEIISHFIWDGGVFILSLALVLSASKIKMTSQAGETVPSPRVAGADRVLILLGAALYGFTFTVNGIEGQTVVMTFPAALVGFLTGLFFYIKIRKVGGENPFLLFFLTAYLISLCLFVFWGLSRGGFPEFSELGWI